MAMNLDNWNYCHYTTGQLKAMISSGLDLRFLRKGPADSMLYWVTVLKDETQEVFQAEFENLTSAVKSINRNYKHWDFVDTGKAAGGCGSCSNKK